MIRILLISKVTSWARTRTRDQLCILNRSKTSLKESILSALPDLAKSRLGCDLAKSRLGCGRESGDQTCILRRILGSLSLCIQSASTRTRTWDQLCILGRSKTSLKESILSAPTWTRTRDQSCIRRRLYQLSYGRT